MTSYAELDVADLPRAPLSPSQEGLWFLNQLEPDNSAYHNVLAIRFQGPLDVSILERSLNEIVRRHEALRTRIAVLDGVPTQFAMPDATLPVRVVNAVTGTSHDPFDEALRQARDEARRPFDLAADPAIRALLLRVRPTDWLLVITVHHTVCDGAGITILLRELITLYAALQQRKPSPLPDLPIEYIEAARKQSERLSGHRAAEGISFWKRQLAEAPPLLDLPTDRPRAVVQGARGGIHRIELPGELTMAVRSFSAREGVTVYMTFLTALQLLLHRYSGQRDVLVGSPVTSRTRKELRGMIAYLANTVVLRADIDPGLTVRQLLRRVRETAREAFQRSDVPFERVVRALRPPRNRSHHPIFQVALSYHERGDGWLHASSFTIPTLEVSFPTVDVDASRFDLSLCVHEVGDRMLGIDFEYSAELFDLSTIERMATHFQQLLAGLARSPDAPVSQVEMLTDAERDQLLRQWSSGPVIKLVGQRLHQLFEAQAARAPDACAVAHDGQQMTYAELDRRANQLAHRLRAVGVRPGQLVGVCLRRSPDLIVGLLGVLKAGAGYVFVEPSLPRRRREFMLRDSGAHIVVAQESTMSAVPAEAATVRLNLDSLVADHEPAWKPPEMASGEDLAYCVYTSGSTGQPKAVAIRHLSCVSFLQWGATVFEPEDLAGTLFASSPMFDCPLFELFLPLSWGGTVILVDSLLDLPGHASSIPVTLFMGAPTVVAELVAAGGIPASVRAVNLAGEAVPRALPGLLYRSTSVQRVFNYYGPSEATTLAIGTLLPPADAVEPGTCPPIGRPIANTQVYVLDVAMNPVPAGAIGELYIGGTGLARGYLGRPGLTTERFLPDPFGTAPGARLYRTGDLARYRADGQIEYVGRGDRQVKLRGFRIELDEVEAILGQYPGVERVVVMLREDQPGRKRLVAYLVPAADAKPTPADLRAFLRERLPDHEVPAAFVMLTELPVAANGKIAVTALPAPEPEAVDGVELWRLADAIEAQVRIIWNELLGIEGEIDVQESFFDLGGDSLLSVVMLTRVRQIFGIPVPVGAFMAAPTLEALSAAIRSQGWSMPSSGPIKVFGNSEQRAFFCIHPGGGELYELRYLQQELGDRPVYALMPIGWNGEAEPVSSIQEMASRYLDDIRSIQPHGPYLLGGLSLAGLIAFEMAHRLCADGEEVAFLGLLETWPVLEGAVCLPEDAYEYQSTTAAQDLAAQTGRIVIPAQELLYMKRLSPAIPALDALQQRVQDRYIYDFDGLCQELEDMRPQLRAALDQLKARGLVVNEMDMADFYRMHEVAAKQIWAKSTYRPRPYGGKAVLFAGPSVDAPLLRQVWSALVGDLQVEEVAAEVHTELLRDPQFAQALRRRLDEAEDDKSAAQRKRPA